MVCLGDNIGLFLGHFVANFMASLRNCLGVI